MTLHPQIEKLFRDSMNYWGSRGQLGRPTMALDAAPQRRQPARKPKLGYDACLTSSERLNPMIDGDDPISAMATLVSVLKKELEPGGLYERFKQMVNEGPSEEELENVGQSTVGTGSAAPETGIADEVDKENPTGDPNYGLIRPAMDRQLHRRFPDASRIAVDSYGKAAPPKRASGPSKGFAERFPDAARIKNG